MNDSPLISLLPESEMTLLMDALVNALSSGSHWLRVNILVILTHFPRNKLSSVDASSIEDAEFDVVRCLLEAVQLPISLDSSREFARLIGNIEVLVRAGRLSETQVRISMNFCLGMLSTKFQPYWEPLLSTITTIVSSFESNESMWQQLLHSIESASSSFGISPVTMPDTPSFRDLVTLLTSHDDGTQSFPTSIRKSVVFPFVVEQGLELNVVVEPDARVDPDTLFSNLWSILRRCPDITLKRSRLVVPIFLRFIRNFYYCAFVDEPEVSDLLYHGVLESAPAEHPLNISRKTLTARLEVYLSVFAAVVSPRQLYQHSILLHLYSALVTKSDQKISRLALDCALTYKVPALMPLKDSFYRLVDDKKMRDELVTLDLRGESELLSKDHRAEAISFLSNVLYGRFSARAGGSKAARELGISRRNAVLAFLSRFEANELETFVHLLLRGILPPRLASAVAIQVRKSPKIELVATVWWRALREHLSQMSWSDMQSVLAERIIAYLHLNEQLIKVLGHRLDAYADCLYRVIVLSLMRYHCTSLDEGEGISLDLKDQASKVRSLCLLRLSEFVETFHQSSSFHDIVHLPDSPLDESIRALPSAVGSSMKPPALLRLLHALILHDETVTAFTKNNKCVEICISCLAVRSPVESFSMLSEILTRLLNLDHGTLLIPFAGLLVDCLCRRFVDSDASQNEQFCNLSELKVQSYQNIGRELQLILDISEFLFLRNQLSINAASVSNLASVLLGILRIYVNSKMVRVEKKSILLMLEAYRFVVPHLDDANSHAPFLSRLFGPQSRASSPMNDVEVRRKLVEVFAEVASHRSALKALRLNSDILRKLAATDETLIDTRDFNACIPVLQSLAANGQDLNWSLLMGPMTGLLPREATCCNVVIYECLRSMHDSEILMRNAAESAIKRFIDEAFQWSIAPTNEGSRELGWFDCVLAIIIPNIHKGIKQSNDGVRRGFVHLLAHMVRTGSGYMEIIEAFPQLHGDMLSLTNVDPEQDFFENIVHIQLHRRVRALGKVCNMPKEAFNFTSPTVTKVILPLAYNLLTSEDINTKGNQGLATDIGNSIGALSLHLPWSQYYGVVKYLLKQLNLHRVAAERSLLNAICSVLDSFHFDLSINVDSTETAQELATRISEALTQSVLPWLQVFMTKQETNKKNQPVQNLRPLVAVALAKLISQLHPPTVSEAKKRGLLDNLILSIVNVLKSRDSGARDAARDSLSRIIRTLGKEMMFPVLYELDRSLTEGYQRHVRNYTIRSVLADALTDYSPPSDYPLVTLDTDISSFDIDLPPFDKCIPLVVASVLDDLLGEAHEDRTADGAVRTLIREAKGTKANEILEICARNILFRPSYALLSSDDPARFSTAHALVSPLLNSLNEAVPSEVFGRVGEALQRIALGLSKNSSLVLKEALVYIYSSLIPSLAKFSTSSKGSDTSLPSYFKDSREDLDILRNNESATKANVSSWNSRTDGYNQKTAIAMREKERKELHAVQDGFSAPKLTGANRHKRLREEGKGMRVDPAELAALRFSLNLLYFCLKQHISNDLDEDTRNTIRPFFPVLRGCLAIQGAKDVTISAMRCLSLLLSWDGIRVDPIVARDLGEDILSLMFRGGALVSTDNELIQACLSGLTNLFKLEVSSKESQLPLNVPTIRSLLQMLMPSVMESSSVFQNSTYKLLRAIVESKVVVPEVYDIVTHLCDQIALSNRKSLRESASSIITTFVLHYPVGENKLSAVMKRLITNCNFEFEEGRFASIDMLCDLVKALPVPVLEEHAVLIFLPIALRLVNETSSKCRERAADVITSLVRRVGKDLLNLILDYTSQWLSQAQVKAQTGLSIESLGLMRTGCQVIAVLVDARSEDLKRFKGIPTVLSQLAFFLSRLVLFKGSDSMSAAEEPEELSSLEQWVVTYYVMNALDRIYYRLPQQTDAAMCDGQLLELTQEAVLYPHSWVRAAACRVVLQFLNQRDFSATSNQGNILADPKLLFGLARRLCAAMNQPAITNSLLEPLNKSLLLVLRAMHDQRAYVDPETPAEEGLDDSMPEDSSHRGSFWIIRRLMGVATNHQGARRASVLKFFKEVVSASEELTASYVGYILELAMKITCSSTERDSDEDKELHLLAMTVLSPIYY